MMSPDYSQFSELEGHRLSGIDLYLLGDEVSVADGPSGRISACEADLGVVLDLADSGRMIVEWGTPGVHEGVSIRRDEVSHGQVCVQSLLSVDPSLGARLAEVIVRVDVVDAEFDWSGRVAPWAAAILLANGVRFSIALGEIEGNAIAYAPDSLVLLLDESIGEQYRIEGARASAWGTAQRS